MHGGRLTIRLGSLCHSYLEPLGPAALYIDPLAHQIFISYRIARPESVRASAAILETGHRHLPIWIFWPVMDVFCS